MRSTILIAACILAVIAADAGHAGAAHKAAAPAAHASASDAPEPLSDMGKKLLWVAFLGLAVPTAYFWQQTMAQEDGKRKYHIITFCITAIASLAYLTMATGHGVYIRPFDGVQHRGAGLHRGGGPRAPLARRGLIWGFLLAAAGDA